MTVTNALIQKAQNHLNQLTRYRNKVMTNREFIVTLLAKGYTPECYAISKVAVPTGRQINRWDNDQYRQHWMKRAKSGTKIEYILKTSNNFFVVSKICFEFALTQAEQPEAQPQLKAFVVFNIPGQNIPGIRTTESKPCVTVYSASVLSTECRVESLIDMDFPGSRVVWYGKARTEQEAFSLAGYN